MDDFRHHPWMDNDTCNIKFAVLYYNYTDWIDFTIVWDGELNGLHKQYYENGIVQLIGNFVDDEEGNLLTFHF